MIFAHNSLPKTLQDMIVAFMEQCREGVRDVGGPRREKDVAPAVFAPFGLLLTSEICGC